jgi:hypothetical protein
MSTRENIARTGLSPQRHAARNRSAMARQQVNGLTGADTNFLLTCSDSTLASYELARLGEVSNLRSQMQEILDRLIDTMSQAAIARWFREADREALRRAIENPLDVLAWANAQNRDGQRSEEELLPSPSLSPSATHLAASLRYTERNIAEGKCGVCPELLDQNSVRYCTKHLTAARMRHKPQGGSDEAPGSINYLYQDQSPEKRHGRQPGTLASLEMAREKRTRKVLAEAGIPPESAAVSYKAAKAALMAGMPDSKEHAMTQSELFTASMISSRSTCQTALSALLTWGKIERTGKGISGNPYRYFRSSAVGAEK